MFSVSPGVWNGSYLEEMVRQSCLYVDCVFGSSIDLVPGVGVSVHLSGDEHAHIGVSRGWSVVVSGVAPASHWAASGTRAPSTDGSAGSQLLRVTASRDVVASTELLGEGAVHLLPSVGLRGGNRQRR